MLARTVVLCLLASGPDRARAAPTPTDKPAPKVRALVIGIDQYEPPPAGSGATAPRPGGSRQWRSLKGAVRDAEGIREMLQKRFGVPAGQISLLLNGQATRDNILGALDQLARESRPGDTAFISYSGHGSQQLNSLSLESDKKDETLVPFDAVAGAPDIRDKTLAAKLDAILDQGADLVALIDSCHSGSATRGGMSMARAIDDATEDARDPTLVVGDPRGCDGKTNCLVAPEVKGAVVIAAAQAREEAREILDENGVPHGAFTQAFLKAVAAGPSDSVERVFARAAAAMASTSRAQTPELRGPVERREKTLLGARAAGAGRVPAVVKTVDERTVTLQGGAAMGLAEGCELTLPAKGATLKVTEVTTPDESRAAVVSTKKPLAVGDELMVTKWKASSFTPLYVFVPSPVATTRLTDLRTQVDRLARSPSVELAGDPTMTGVDGVIVWGDSQWILYAQYRGTPLGPTLDGKSIASRLGLRGKPRIFASLPPLQGLAISGIDEAANAVQRAKDFFLADYLVAGAMHQGKLEYSVLEVAALSSRQFTELPRRGAWHDASNVPALADSLQLDSWNLSHIKGWLTLAPPSAADFPYDLVLTPVGASRPPFDRRRPLFGLGQEVQVSLRSRLGDPESNLKSWWVYLLDIDATGKTQVLFGEREENPMVSGNAAEVPLRKVRVAEPPGLDSLVLLVCDDKLHSTAALHGDAVTKGAPPDDALARLFYNVGATRGTDAVPGGWTVTRAAFRTLRPWDVPEAKGLPPGTPTKGLPDQGPKLEFVAPGPAAELDAPVEVALRFESRTSPVDLRTLKVELVTAKTVLDVTEVPLRQSAPV